MNLSQVDKETETEISKELVMETFGKYNHNNFVGFKTASAKPVNVSADAFAKSKVVFSDIDFEDIIQGKDHVERDHTDESTKFVGFHTASNKEIKICDKALAKSKQILNEIEYNSDDTDDKLAQNDFVGFKTANNKKIKISKDALVKSKQIFNDCEISKDNLTNKVTESVIVGFKTANNNEVTISKSDLAKTKQIFNDIEFQDGDFNEEPEVDKFVGFKTASDKKVTISDEAMAKSKAVFKDINESVNGVKVAEMTDKFNPVFKGFQTASNKHVTISEKAFEKSRKLFQDLNVCKNYENSGTENEKAKVFVAFKRLVTRKLKYLIKL